MTTPWKWLTVRVGAWINLTPLETLEVELPYVIQFVILVIFASKNIHAIPVFIVCSDGCRVPNSFAWCYFGYWLNEFPFICVKIVPVNGVGARAKIETAKDNHGVIVNHTSMFVSCLRVVFWVVTSSFWFQLTPRISL